PRTALQPLAHDAVLDLVVCDIDALERSPDRMRAQLGRLVFREATTQLPERGADSGDDHGTRHESSVACGTRLLSGGPGRVTIGRGRWPAGVLRSIAKPPRLSSGMRFEPAQANTRCLHSSARPATAR